MTNREVTSPVPDPAEVPPTMLLASTQWESIALKWRNLAERRRDQIGRRDAQNGEISVRIVTDEVRH